jgi:hypothetical protein
MTWLNIFKHLSPSSGFAADSGSYDGYPSLMTHDANNNRYFYIGPARTPINSWVYLGFVYDFENGKGRRFRSK